MADESLGSVTGITRLRWWVKSRRAWGWVR